jgi:hypothetical protein
LAVDLIFLLRTESMMDFVCKTEKVQIASSLQSIYPIMLFPLTNGVVIISIVCRSWLIVFKSILRGS